MGYIPQDAKWYLAELVIEITVEGDLRNVLHKNLTLVSAATPDEAYQKSIELGRSEEVSYPNPEKRLVSARFRGISRLSVVHEPLEHGAELAYDEQVDVPEDEISNMIPAKSELSVFAPVTPTKGPDYSSA